MSYLKPLGTAFVYVVAILALITFSPGLQPTGEYSEYSIKPPGAPVGVLAPNGRLNNAELLFNGELKGAECFDSYNGELYTGMYGGYVGKVVGNKIVPVTKFGKDCDGIWDADKCGRPLGLKFDKQGHLYVVDAYHGIFKVDVKTGKYEKVIDTTQPIDGTVAELPNSVDIASNGDIYWTVSSTQFKLHDGVLVLFTDPTGRLMRYNAETKKNEVLVKNLGMANGLKLSDDESFVIVAETMTSRIVKYHLKGQKAGKTEIFVEGLPGMTDNIHSDGQGNFLVSLYAYADPDHPQLSQTLIPHPYLRKLIARVIRLVELPFVMLDQIYPNDFAKKAAHAIGSFESIGFMLVPKATVLRIDGNGKILDTLYNSDEKISRISSAFIHDNYLWLGSPFNEYIARVPLKQAFPNTEFPSKTAEKQRVVREAKVTPQVEKPVEKPVATPKVERVATPKVERVTTPKPATPKPTPKPAPTEAPKVAKTVKVEQAKPAVKDQKETDKKQQAGSTPKKVADTPKPPKKVEPATHTNELPRPIDKAESTKPSKQAPATKATKQQEAPKPQKKTEPVKRNAKLADEI